MKSNLGLSQSAKKALNVHLGEQAGTEVAQLLQRMAAQIEELKRTKVNVTNVIPVAKEANSAIENEVF